MFTRGYLDHFPWKPSRVYQRQVGLSGLVHVLTEYPTLLPNYVRVPGMPLCQMDREKLGLRCKPTVAGFMHIFMYIFIIFLNHLFIIFLNHFLSFLIIFYDFQLYHCVTSIFQMFLSYWLALLQQGLGHLHLVPSRWGPGFVSGDMWWWCQLLWSKM